MPKKQKKKFFVGRDWEKRTTTKKVFLWEGLQIDGTHIHMNRWHMSMPSPYIR
jgi:hypothetical protein